MWVLLRELDNTFYGGRRVGLPFTKPKPNDWIPYECQWEDFKDAFVFAVKGYVIEVKCALGNEGFTVLKIEG